MAVAQTFIGKPWRQPYSAQQLQDSVVHAVPIIGTNGNFWRWNIDTSDWEDTGIAAGAGLADGSVTWPKLAVDARPTKRNFVYNPIFVGGGSQLAYGTFPINQRGQTEYSTSGYTIDRWKLLSGAITLTEGGINIKKNDATQGYGLFEQILRIQTTILGRTSTISVLTTEGLFTITGVISDSPSTILQKAYGPNGSYFRLSYRNGLFFFEFISVSDSDPDIVAAAWELSDHCTVFGQDANGNWVINEIPDYGEELAKCQRYQPFVGDINRQYTSVGVGVGYTTNQASILIPTPVSIRAKPASPIPFTGNFVIRHGSSGVHSVVDSVSVAMWSQNSIIVYATLKSNAPPMTVGEACDAFMVNGMLMPDCNL